MKTFQVLRKVAKGSLHEEEILSDGLPVAEDDYDDSKMGGIEIVLSLLVQVYDDYDTIEEHKYYVPVGEIEERDGVLGNYKSVEQVLEQIRQDYPPDKYQNHEW